MYFKENIFTIIVKVFFLKYIIKILLIRAV